MTRYLDLSHEELIRLWRCLVRCEIFERLELTHTCVRYRPTINKFPEEDRLEIEEEEEELYLHPTTIPNCLDVYNANNSPKSATRRSKRLKGSQAP
jgi:hypothetical protein